MMYDRPYMTTSFDEKAKKTLFWIIGINVGVFFLQNVLNAAGAPQFMGHYFAFSYDSLAKGFIWTPLTYSFLHGVGNWLHIIGNMLGIFFIGRVILPVLGQKRFLQLYFASVLVGGLLWFALTFISGAGSVVGASAAVFGLLTFFACVYPDREIQMLLFFVLPIRVKPKVLAYVMLGISILGLLFQELFSTGGYRVAHSAHLGGMLTGYLFFKYVYTANPYDNSGNLNLSLARFFKKPSAKKSKTTFNYKVNVSSKQRDLKREVDRILDKINSKGFGSLDAEEKKTLDEARDLLRRR
ncbi:rhomboid family intramembrane serine protease [Pelagicoccus sp. SDUM812003]|uniref:rhomboid family intramembrane serine protease n=1 Tax=Pelagicoccus sp. SDUM812003 TaxID=3041267 RepID=UPI00280D5C1A|nr:rhomboid family intramembrane serine protease [Pelagicoccus sp. SDUM812003]MDQ8205185.1 rhomboid family intramembrane serine protease [Pelagicoccus sp. SDUM812003]